MSISEPFHGKGSWERQSGTADIGIAAIERDYRSATRRKTDERASLYSSVERFLKRGYLGLQAGGDLELEKRLAWSEKVLKIKVGSIGGPNGISVSGPLNVIDEFLNNAPFTLNAGASDMFEFFQVAINSGTLPGVYGTDGSDVFSFFGDFNGAPIEDDVKFTADVTGPVATTPEPGMLLLVCGGLGLVALGYRRCGFKA